MAAFVVNCVLDDDTIIVGVPSQTAIVVIEAIKAKARSEYNVKVLDSGVCRPRLEGEAAPTPLVHLTADAATVAIAAACVPGALGDRLVVIGTANNGSIGFVAINTPAVADMMGIPVDELPMNADDVLTFFANDHWPDHVIPLPHVVNICAGSLTVPASVIRTGQVVVIGTIAENTFIKHLDSIVSDSLSYFLEQDVIFVRNITDVTVLKSGRPDALYTSRTRGALLLRGEEKAAQVNFREAIHDLTKKLTINSEEWMEYFGNLPYVFGYFSSGFVVGMCTLWRSGDVTIFLNPVDTSTTVGALALIKAIRSVARLWRFMHTWLPSTPKLEHLTILRPRARLDHIVRSVVITKTYSSRQHRIVKAEADLVKRLAGVQFVAEVVAYNNRSSIGFLYGIPGSGENIADADVPNALRCVLMAVQCMQTQHIAHRDIRWPNIVQRYPIVNSMWMLVDFELALDFENPPMDELYYTGLVGDEHAPESSMSDCRQDRVDFWGFGRLLSRLPGYIALQGALVTEYGERRHDCAGILAELPLMP